MRLPTPAHLAFWPALALLAGCGGGRDPSLIAVSGHVEATEVRISAKVGGTLQRFELREGDAVQRGRLLARIDPVDLELALAATRAERDQAEADLRLRLAGTREEEIAEAGAQVTQVQSDLEGAEKDLERMQGLFESGSGTAKARDDARTRRDMAAARLEAARERLRRLRAGSRREEIDAARARLRTAEARIAQLEQEIEDATVESPLDGVITEKLVEQGEVLAPGTPLAVVTDLGDAWLTAYVAEPDLARIRLGQEAEVRTDDGQVRRGRITYISPRAEFTPKNVQTRDERVKLVFKIKIGLDNADGLFKPGMPAEARMHAAQGPA
jgi:HlyD family secretion protein